MNAIVANLLQAGMLEALGLAAVFCFATPFKKKPVRALAHSFNRTTHSGCPRERGPCPDDSHEAVDCRGDRADHGSRQDLIAQARPDRCPSQALRGRMFGRRRSADGKYFGRETRRSLMVPRRVRPQRQAGAFQGYGRLDAAQDTPIQPRCVFVIVDAKPNGRDRSATAMGRDRLPLKAHHHDFGRLRNVLVGGTKHRSLRQSRSRVDPFDDLSPLRSDV